jgi:glycerol-3-phosphate dehydrogenase
MAEDAVNAAVRSGNLKPANGCVTDNLHIVGGYGWDPAAFTVLAQNYKRMKKTYGGKVIPGAMDSAVSKHLSHAYGTLAEQVATIAQVCSPLTPQRYLCEVCSSRMEKKNEDLAPVCLFICWGSKMLYAWFSRRHLGNKVHWDSGHPSYCDKKV